MTAPRLYAVARNRIDRLTHMLWLPNSAVTETIHNGHLNDETQEPSSHDPTRIAHLHA